MRRQERYISNGILLGGGLLALADILIQWYEHYNQGQKFSWESYNGKRTLKNAVLGGIVGGGIGYVMYCYKISEEEKLPFNSDEYLKKVLTEEHLKTDPILYRTIIEYREKVKLSLFKIFEDKLASFPEETGSFYKRTAINSKYDLDIILPFKRSSYSTLEKMYYDVYELVNKEFGSNATIIKHTKAIGITFDINEIQIHFDIVPGREISNYKTEKDLNLYVRPDWIWQRGSSFKTNTGVQKKITVNKPEARNIIKLLKVYRNKNDLHLPSVLIEQCVVDALTENNFGIHPSLTENLLNCMDFMSRKLDQKSLIDIANTNNNLNYKLSDIQKSYVISQLQHDIKKIEHSSRYIREILNS